MITNVVLVHGYSVRSLDTYGKLPQLLIAAGIHPTSIYLSAFDSLNDDITCDDLAKALEFRVLELIRAQGIDLQHTAFVCHSTGAIITRRWLLNRYANNLPVPRLLVTMAGANHGSTLAQLGKSQLAFFLRHVFQQSSVGQEVLEDLDYGSLFLLKLNEDWLEAYNSATPPSCYAFSMIGDDHSEPDHQLFWQTKESGSDGTVRICGGNLNYEMLSIDLTAAHPVLNVKRLAAPVPFIVLTGYSHTGGKGIIDALEKNTDPPFVELLKALAVASDSDYQKVRDDWQSQTVRWIAAHNSDCNATAVFSLQHPGARRIEDSLILISDNKNEYLSVTTALQGHQPIQNDTNLSSFSFYFNQPTFAGTSPHKLHIEVHSGSDEITYTDIDYVIPPEQASLLRPNQFTYMAMTLDRNATGTYKLLVFDPTRDPTKKWLPLPS